MARYEDFVFKVADQPWEFEAIHALNYKTFVEEIPQHGPNPDRKLVDKLHEENVYVICVHETHRELAGMIAFRDRRPFSLDQKLPDLDAHLPAGRSLCEIRLLAVEPRYRYSRITQGLIARLVQHGIDCGHDLALISGTLRQTKLYRYLGFVPFGPVVGMEEAAYQPMYLTLEAYQDLKQRSRSFSREPPELAYDDTMLFNFLPGPVDYSQQVHDVYSERPCSHRGDQFERDFNDVREHLCRIVRARDVQIMPGPGTMANDALAGQLALLEQSGLILVSGEFGHRLVSNARAAGLSFHVMEIPEGDCFEAAGIEAVLREHPQARWLWATHCETSTGVLHDLDMLKQLCATHGLLLCLDCISSIGTVPVNLEGVYLASGTSGKGLASITGLALVFHDHDLQPSPSRLPCVLDLGLYQQQNGIPHTIQTNLVYALVAALNRYDWEKRFTEVRQWSTLIRKRLAEINVSVLAPEETAMPAIVTIPLPPEHVSVRVGDALKKHGVLVHYQSTYLLDRNWIQVCMMGANKLPTDKFVRLLKRELIE